MGLRFCFVGVLLLVALPALAAIKPIVVDVYGHDSDNYLRVKLHRQLSWLVSLRNGCATLFCLCQRLE